MGRKLRAIAFIASALLTGALAGVAFPQARATLTNGAVVTIRSVVAGSFNIGTMTASRVLAVDSSKNLTSSFASASLTGALTDETGTGVAVFATSPSFTTPALGTPSAIVLTNASGSPSLTTLLIKAGGGTQTYTPGGALYWENTATDTTAGSTNAVTGTAYSIPASTMAANGDRLFIDGSVTLAAATTDNKNFRCNIGYTSVNAAGTFTGGLDVVTESSTSNQGTLSWTIHGVVTRLGAASLSYEWYSRWNSSATTQGLSYATSSALTWTNAYNFLCEVYNSTASNTQVLTLNQYRLTWMPR